MTNKYKNKYRIPSSRLQNWDYDSNVLYFVTICTAQRECYFGKIIDGNMELSEIGKMVETEWIKTVEMRPDMNLQLGEYVVMPNHFHAIIIIGENRYNKKCNVNAVCGDGTGGTDGRDAMHRVSTATTATTATNTSDYVIEHKNKFGSQSKNLASIIRGFKSAVTINARKCTDDFAWQSRFHDHIIRNNKSLQRIEQYIINNPVCWLDDPFCE